MQIRVNKTLFVNQLVLVLSFPPSFLCFCRYLKLQFRYLRYVHNHFLQLTCRFKAVFASIHTSSQQLGHRIRSHYFESHMCMSLRWGYVVILRSARATPAAEPSQAESSRAKHIIFQITEIFTESFTICIWFNFK